MSPPPFSKLSIIEALILHLLRQAKPKALYGLEMVRLSAAGKLELKKGTIYVTLERMEKKGLVVSEFEAPPVNAEKFYIPRRMYKPTTAGLKSLDGLESAIAKIPGGFLAG